MRNCTILYLTKGLRRRINTKQKGVKEEEQDTEPQVKTKAESSTSEHRDPLKWFGILVPQNLKQAQSAFKEGELFCDVFYKYGLLAYLIFSLSLYIDCVKFEVLFQHNLFVFREMLFIVFWV